MNIRIIGAFFPGHFVNLQVVHASAIIIFIPKNFRRHQHLETKINTLVWARIFLRMFLHVDLLEFFGDPRITLKQLILLLPIFKLSILKFTFLVGVCNASLIVVIRVLGK